MAHVNSSKSSDETNRHPCVVSVAEHTGWAHVVCVAAPGGVPSVVERRRVALIDSHLPAQPYEHDTSAMREDAAAALIARVKASVAAHALAALRRIGSDLRDSHPVVALAIRTPPFATLPDTVAEVRASYRLLCAADGILFQMALCEAARQLRVPVTEYRRGDERMLAARQLDTTVDALDDFIARTGRPPGPPWTQEHRQAFAAGIAALAERSPRRLRIPGATSVST